MPSGAAYPSSLRRQELPVEAFRQIQGTQSALDDFRVILAQPERVVTPFGNAMMREMSTEWRGNATGARTFRHSVRSYLDGLTKKVRLIQKSEATLSGRSATIPVTVQNNLVQGVKDMTLKLTSSQPNRLDAGKSQQITVDGGHSQSFKFDTTANANGRAWVTAQLYTADGKPYGEPMTFQGERHGDHRHGDARHRGRRAAARARRRADLSPAQAGGRPARTENGSDGDGPDGGQGTDGDNGGTDGDEPEQPSDPTPDTGSESSDPSGSGEKVDR